MVTRKFHGSACCGSQQKALAGNATGGPKSTCALLLIALEIAGPGKEALAGNRCNMLLQLHPFTLFRHRWEDRLKTCQRHTKANICQLGLDTVNATPTARPKRRPFRFAYTSSACSTASWEWQLSQMSGPRMVRTWKVEEGIIWESKAPAGQLSWGLNPGSMLATSLLLTC